MKLNLTEGKILSIAAIVLQLAGSIVSNKQDDIMQNETAEKIADLVKQKIVGM